MTIVGRCRLIALVALAMGCASGTSMTDHLGLLQVAQAQTDDEKKKKERAAEVPSYKA